MNTKEIKPGDFFSEVSYYRKESGTGWYTHMSTGERVKIEDKYAEKYFGSADQFSSTEKVGLENKKDGTPGIRTIFENIGTQTFTAMFLAQSKETKTQLKKRKEDQRNAAIEAIEKARTGKKSIAKTAAEWIQQIQENPIVPEPRVRIMKAYKKAWSSRDGKYPVYDLENEGDRLININTIAWLIVDGTCFYTASVEKDLKDKGVL